VLYDVFGEATVKVWRQKKFRNAYNTNPYYKEKDFWHPKSQANKGTTIQQYIIALGRMCVKKGDNSSSNGRNIAPKRSRESRKVEHLRQTAVQNRHFPDGEEGHGDARVDDSRAEVRSLLP
jgi:hypothetical protein